jgi:glycosyl transferase family 2
MGRNPSVKETSIIRLERPLFGQFARHVLGLPSNELRECLTYQDSVGGKLGEILLSRGCFNREQIFDILRTQARWVATAFRHESPGLKLPYPGFLSLCMPAYNENSNIEDTLEAACVILPEFIERFEIVVVDDGSTDGTADTVDAYARRDSRVRLIRHEQNRGYGAAVTSGIQSARGDLVAFTDSDGQFSLLDLPQLISRIDGHDLVVGYRHQRADNWIRRMNAWGWNWLIRTILGLQVRDLDCAFKLFRREVINRLCLTATGAAINAEILVQCARAGWRMHETPVTHYPRYHGSPTGAAIRVIWRAFRELPRLWRYRAVQIPVSEPSGSGAKIEPDTDSVPVAG